MAGGPQIAGPQVAGLPHDHVVTVYDDDESLLAQLAGFVAAGVEAEEAVVVIATPAHRRALDASVARGDVAAPARGYVSVDAGEVLAAFMVDGLPDRDRFTGVATDVLRGAASGPRPRSDPAVAKVRAFGEMVALLWEAGNVAGAIELESLWNELARKYAFSLCCAYPLSSFTTGGDLAAISQVCDRHSRVIPPASYDVFSPSATPIASGERSQLFVPAESAVRAARRFAAETLGAWDEDGLVDDVSLIVSELATNALQHARSPFQMSIRTAGGAVTIAVHDVSSIHPQAVDAAPEAQGGRGIAVIVKLSSSWGTYATPHGKVVWSELDRSRSASPSSPA